AYKILFGDTTSAGYVTFFDALYDPNGSPNKPLVMDVVTVHHQGYYQDKNEPPADWDSPNPVPFVSVRDGVKFRVALAGPDEWVDAAFQILKLALADEGIGAKTNSGYGRMELVEEARELSPDEAFREKVKATSDINKDFVTLYDEWENLEVPDDVKHDLARLILEKVDASNLPKTWEKKAKKEKTRKKALRNQERYAALVAATGKKG
ncbi:MAG: type III-B CRISPR module RAMP protein Cmr6, partial [Gammaproteobacteria bacterium]